MEPDGSLGGSLVTTAWRMLRLWMKVWRSAMEGSCKYIEKAAAGQMTRGASSLGVGHGANNPSP
jgi:hypothetical protein